MTNVFYSNHTPNQVLPLTGNDVMVLSPLGGTASDFFMRMLLGLPRLSISV